MNLQIMRPHPVTVGEALHRAVTTLAPTSPTPRLDAEVLVMHVCGLDRSGLVTRDRTTLTGDQPRRLEELLTRRQRGEPIAYLTGTREFWSLEFNVSPATLIPRPETELLVEKALAHIPRDAEWAIADLGTGCGTVALAIAGERPRCRIIATDISSAALEVAQSNIEKFGLTNVELRQGDWFSALAGEKLDMLVSNPPYVRADDPHLEQGDVRFEPATALVSGADGLDAIRQIASQARQRLKPGSWLLFEHGWDQAELIHDILHNNGWHRIACHPDLAGYGRVTEAVAT